MQPLPVLTGEKTLLRPMEAGDQPCFQAWLAENEDLRCLIDDPRIPTPEDQEKWFRRAQEPDRQMFSILALPKRELIGNCGLVDIVEGDCAQIRITIGNTAFLGRGHGSEALRLLVHYAFQEMRLHSLWLRVRRDNERAVHLYRKLGFTEEGEEPNGILRMRKYGSQD